MRNAPKWETITIDKTITEGTAPHSHDLTLHVLKSFRALSDAIEKKLSAIGLTLNDCYAEQADDPFLEHRTIIKTKTGDHIVGWWQSYYRLDPPECGYEGGVCETRYWDA